MLMITQPIKHKIRLMTSLHTYNSHEKLFKWFAANRMKGNTDKCHLVKSSNDSTETKNRDVPQTKQQ